MPHVRPAKIADILQIIPRLRQEDINELRAANGQSLLQTLSKGIVKSTEAFTVEHEGIPCALFGVSPATIENVGIPWFICTTELLNHQITFLRQCRKWVERMHEHFPLLVNYADARNHVHLRWLKWCGFSLVKIEQHAGVAQIPFVQFGKIQHV